MGNTWHRCSGLLLSLFLLAGCGGKPAAPPTSSPATPASPASAPEAPSVVDKIKSSGVLKVGMAVDPPFVLKDKDGKFYSFNPELVQMLGQKLGVKIEYVDASWETMVAGLQTGKFDLIGASIGVSPERQKAIDFTNPYTYGGSSFLVKQDGPKKLTSMDELAKGKITVAAPTNTYQDQLSRRLLPNAEVKALPNAGIAELVSELQSGRSDAISVPVFFVPALKKAYPWMVAIPDDDKGLEPVGVAWGMRKGDQKFQDALNAFLKEQMDNGTVNKLLIEWVKPENIMK